MRVDLTRPAEKALADSGADEKKVLRWLGDWFIDHRPQRIYRDAMGELYAVANGGDLRRALRSIV